MIFANKSRFSKINTIKDSIKENFIWLFLRFLPKTNIKRLEHEWIKLNRSWQVKYWNLSDKFDSLNENNFINDKEILNKFEALKYIDKFKDCTLYWASDNIYKITLLLNIDYIIYNNRITGFTYVLIKEGSRPEDC